MIKKVFLSIISTMLIMTTVGCGSEEKIEDISPNSIEKSHELLGAWAGDFTREEVENLHNEILSRVENVSINFGLTAEYDIKEEIREENGTTVNDNRIYLDIENPDSNRIESMYYGYKQYGSDLSSGVLSMKVGLNLDESIIKGQGYFDFTELAICDYSEAFTGVIDRDYTELNSEIYNMISNGEIGSIENNLDGVKETITITDGFLLYKLETKLYEFK